MSGYTLTTEHLRRMWVLESNLLDHDDAGPAFDRWLVADEAASYGPFTIRWLPEPEDTE